MTANTKAFRRAVYEYRSKEGDDNEQYPRVYLFEQTDTTAVPWAYWSPEKEPNDATYNFADFGIVADILQYDSSLIYAR